MKKVLSALILTSLLAIPMVSLAQFEDPGEDAPTLLNSGEDLLNLIEVVGNWIFVILLGIAAILLLIAGFQFVTAGGNPEKVNGARRMLVNALIGVAVGLGARGMVEVIKSVLGN